jgi:hypothetical protein
MTANQIPYDAIDWLQIAIYFLALPIVALLGAAIGLLGRWRRGGVLWSTNIGLLGGAVTCIILALGLSTIGLTKSKWYHDYFLTDYRWMMLLTTLGATAACALAASLAWRCLHRPKEIRPLNISLANVMLVQTFALLSMGSFVGLRLVVLQSAIEVAADPIIWSVPGWKLAQNGVEGQFDVANLSPKERAQALTAAQITKVGRTPDLRFVTLDYDPAWNVDLSPLLSATQIGGITIKIHQPSQDLIQQLASGKIPHLKLEGDFRALDLSPLAHSKSIRSLRLTGEASIETLESLQSSESLNELALENLKLSSRNRALAHWPKSLSSLIVAKTNLQSRDFNSLQRHPKLKQVLASDLVLDDDCLTSLQSIPNLTWVASAVESTSNEDFERVANWKIPRIGLQLRVQAITADDLRRLKRITSMRSLEVITSAIDDEAIDVLAEMNSVEHLMLTTGAVTEAGLWKLATLPRLRSLKIPQSAITKRVEAHFTLDRNAMNLSSVLLQSHATANEPVSP